MRVLTVYAHPDPASFNHAVLEAFTRGLVEAGHQREVVDLYAIGFDPVSRRREQPSWTPGAGPLRRRREALIISSTSFDDAAYPAPRARHPSPSRESPSTATSGWSGLT